MSSKLNGVRIACFYPWKPFESTGSWNRFECLWRYLLDQGAHVTLAFLDQGKNSDLGNLAIRYQGEPAAIYGLGLIYDRIEAGLKAEMRNYSSAERDFLIMYEKEFYHTTSKIQPWLQEIIAGADIVTCEYPMQVPLLADLCKALNRKLVVTSHDMLFELHGVNPTAKELLKKKEVHAMGLADACVFCSEREREAFSQLGVSGVTVRNTGDAKRINLEDEETSRAKVQAQLKLKTKDYCFFVGSAHGPNMESVAEIKKIAKQFPKLTFVVAGRCHDPVVDGNFMALGMVDEHLLDALYRGAYAVVVPMARGTGTSVKTYHAIAYGKAIVSTAVGARGLSLVDGEHLLMVNTPAEVVTGLRRLLADEPLRMALGVKARAYALELDFRREFKSYGDIIANWVPPKDESSKPPARSLFLADNNLSDRTGHHFNYALALKQECSEAGLAFRGLVSARATGEILKELEARPVFSQGIHEGTAKNPYPAEWGPLRSTYDFLQANDCFSKELEEGLSRAARSSDVVFIPNATPGQILGLALLLHRHPSFKCLTFVLVLRYSVQFSVGPLNARRVGIDREMAERYVLGLEKLMSVGGSCVRLATDSAELAKEYGALAKVSVEVLPIPHTSLHAGDAGTVSLPAKNPSIKRVVFMGDARDEKGFELLPTAIRACALAGLSQVEFVFQAFVSSSYHSKMWTVIEEMERLRRPNVHLLKRSLSVSEYQALLSSADLVLLPYEAATYRARTSGPFIEAICADKPVVVTKLTWMSAQLGASDAGVTFTSGNANEFAKALVGCLKNLDQHRLAAVELGATFRKIHNPTSFLSALVPQEVVALEAVKRDLVQTAG